MEEDDKQIMATDTDAKAANDLTHKVEPKSGFAGNLVSQREYLYGLVYLECYFCGKFKTPIPFDMELHVYEKHKQELFESLPIKGNMDKRIAYVIMQMQVTGRKHKHFFGPECFE